jgi:UDP-3-O-acyl-N-acetylglucosamine deacetylase
VSYLTQKTIKNNVSFSGVALHSGLDVIYALNQLSLILELFLKE